MFKNAAVLCRVHMKEFMGVEAFCDFAILKKIDAVCKGYCFFTALPHRPELKDVAQALKLLPPAPFHNLIFS